MVKLSTFYSEISRRPTSAISFIDLFKMILLSCILLSAQTPTDLVEENVVSEGCPIRGMDIRLTTMIPCLRRLI
jgi:hypothetical protein